MIGSTDKGALEKGQARPQVLLAHHLKALRLPTFLSQYEKVAGECARDGVDHPRYLLRLAELELIERERRMIDRQIRAAKFPAIKTLDSFDFMAIPALNKMLVLELARCEYIERRENVIALGPSGTGKSHLALALGLAACQRGFSTGFVTAAGLVHLLMEARDERRLLKLQAHLASLKLLIVDELGYVPLSLTGSELLFEVFSQRYERGATIVTSNLPFEDWTSVFSSERLTGALLDRLTHHVHILEMNGDSYRLRAVPALMESRNGSRLLFCRASYRKTGSHFSGSTLSNRRADGGKRHAAATVLIPLRQRRLPPSIPKPARSPAQREAARKQTRKHEGPPRGGPSCFHRQRRQWPTFTPPRRPRMSPPLTVCRCYCDLRTERPCAITRRVRLQPDPTGPRFTSSAERDGDGDEHRAEEADH